MGEFIPNSDKLHPCPWQEHGTLYAPCVEYDPIKYMKFLSHIVYFPSVKHTESSIPVEARFSGTAVQTLYSKLASLGRYDSKETLVHVVRDSYT